MNKYKKKLFCYIFQREARSREEREPGTWGNPRRRHLHDDDGSARRSPGNARRRRKQSGSDEGTSGGHGTATAHQGVAHGGAPLRL